MPHVSPRALSYALLMLSAAACVRHDQRGDVNQTEPAPGEGRSTEGDALPPGTPLLSDQGTRSFRLFGAEHKVELALVDVAGQPFGEALRAKIQEAGASEWEVQLTAPTVARVSKNDAILATFFARVTEEQESGGGETQFVFELAADPYTKSVSYGVPLTPEWREVQVRFRAAADYEPGRAQMIFRLGYAPQTLEIGGVSVESFGSEVELSRLPTTQAVDRRLAQRGPVVAPLLEPVDGGELTIVVDATRVIRQISPYVYGINSQDPGASGATVRRNGGNRGSAYNWEGNFSNAGEDYHHQNDRWPCTVMGIDDCSEPAAQLLGFVEQNRAANAETVVTIPMLDWVSADDRGPVPAEQAPPSERFVRSEPRKEAAFSASPDTADGVVYQDELVHYLVQKAGDAKRGGVMFYSLDNEPALWRTTHPRVHPKATSYEEIVRRTEATASAIKDVDANAFVLSGVMFGWSEYLSLSGAPDHEKFDAEYGNYLEYFLDAMRRLDEKHGRRLADALDVHWYPEARGTQRITLEDASRSTIDARLQAPRSLWDDSYRERSWITQQTGKPIRLIRWLLEAIEKRYPGTRLAMTEYNFGATKHVSGGLAQVDVLGVLGREGVYLANYWGNGAGVGKLPAYVESAFRLYRNYDGEGGQFGERALAVSVSNDEAASAFAAEREDGALTIIVVNKHQQNRYSARIDLKGAPERGRMQTFSIGRDGPEIVAGEATRVRGRSLELELAPLSATLFVLER